MNERERDLYAKWDSELIRYQNQEVKAIKRNNKTQARMYEMLANLCHSHMKDLASSNNDQ